MLGLLEMMHETGENFYQLSTATSLLFYVVFFGLMSIVLPNRFYNEMSHYDVISFVVVETMPLISGGQIPSTEHEIIHWLSNYICSLIRHVQVSQGTRAGGDSNLESLWESLDSCFLNSLALHKTDQWISSQKVVNFIKQFCLNKACYMLAFETRDQHYKCQITSPAL